MLSASPAASNLGDMRADCERFVAYLEEKDAVLAVLMEESRTSGRSVCYCEPKRVGAGLLRE